jgi:hypothetical protein
MNKHYYDIVNGDGDLVMEITSSFTNLTKDEYFNDHLVGEVLAAMSHAFGECPIKGKAKVFWDVDEEYPDSGGIVVTFTDFEFDEEEPDYE